MSTRIALFAFAALLAAPLAATAKTTPAHRAHPHVTARHTAAHPARAARMAPRDAGSAAVDALNDQSLARARGTGQ